MNILSVQSHVAYGHVGNAAAVFALQRLGHEVWPVHTVQFSNHPGHGRWGGAVLGGGHVAAVLDGLAGLGVLGRCGAVLSGYLGAAAVGPALAETVRRVKAANPAAPWCCDPVMGDVGAGLYVAPGIAAFMREVAVPAADVLTPNQFELELLSGRAIGDRAQALAAARGLRERGPGIVLVTSLCPDGAIHNLVAAADGAWTVSTPLLPFREPPRGAGDALAALFLGRLLQGHAAPKAASLAVSSLFAVLERSAEGDLALVAAQDLLVAPPRLFAPEPA